MNSFALFTDVSVNLQLKLGIGGYLLVPLQYLEVEPNNILRNAVSAGLKTRSFADTSSTRLEVQTVLWALEELEGKLAGGTPGGLRIYTDSQCVTGLARRRAGLEQMGFISKRTGLPLTNAPLYRAFYAAYDQLGFQLIKVPGHSRASSHDTVQRIFSYVDREVRQALNFWLGLIRMWAKSICRPASAAWSPCHPP
jgi:ribonuclease HI